MPKGRRGDVTSHHSGLLDPCGLPGGASILIGALTKRLPMGIDIHLIANFAALALITLAGPAVIFLLFYRRGAL